MATVTATVSRRALVSGFSSALLGGCGALWRPSPIAMDLLQDERACTRQAPVQLLLLPGANMQPAEMVEQGMVQAGRRTLMQEVAAAGGPAHWRGAARPRGADDVDHDLWQWLSARPADAPTLHLAYDREDLFADGHRLLAQTLAPAQVQVVAGGHDWPAWRALWSDWLDKQLLPVSCAA